MPADVKEAQVITEAASIIHEEVVNRIFSNGEPS